MYAIIRKNTYDPDQLAHATAALAELRELHTAQPGYVGSIEVDVGDRQTVVVNLWLAEHDAVAGRTVLVRHVQRLLEPLMLRPSQLLGSGEVAAQRRRQQRQGARGRQRGASGQRTGGRAGRSARERAPGNAGTGTVIPFCRDGEGPTVTGLARLLVALRPRCWRQEYRGARLPARRLPTQFFGGPRCAGPCRQGAGTGSLCCERDWPVTASGCCEAVALWAGLTANILWVPTNPELALEVGNLRPWSQLSC